jgi:hypothetical protein
MAGSGVTERLLHRVQDHQRRAFQLVVFGDDLGAARFIQGSYADVIRVLIRGCGF